MRIPRRIVPRTLISLCVGAFITLLIAWNAALRAPITWVKGPIPPEVPSPADWGIPNYFRTARGPTMRATRCEWPGIKGLGNGIDGSHSITFDAKYFDSYAVGWPAPALSWTAVITETGTSRVIARSRVVEKNVVRRVTGGGLATPATLLGLPIQPDRRLPVAPLRGFAIDTAAYAGAFTLLFFAPNALRARIRRRRGLCARCGYSLLDLPTNAPCPECSARPVCGRHLHPAPTR